MQYFQTWADFYFNTNKSELVRTVELFWASSSKTTPNRLRGISDCSDKHEEDVSSTTLHTRLLNITTPNTWEHRNMNTCTVCTVLLHDWHHLLHKTCVKVERCFHCESRTDVSSPCCGHQRVHSVRSPNKKQCCADLQCSNSLSCSALFCVFLGPGEVAGFNTVFSLRLC